MYILGLSKLTVPVTCLWGCTQHRYITDIHMTHHHITGAQIIIDAHIIDTQIITGAQIITSQVHTSSHHRCTNHYRCTHHRYITGAQVITDAHITGAQIITDAHITADTHITGAQEEQKDTHLLAWSTVRVWMVPNLLKASRRGSSPIPGW